MLKIFKHDLFVCVVITAVVMLSEFALGRPFFGAGLSSVNSQAQKALVFQGAVVRSGDQLLLRDTMGEEFLLDSMQQAEQYLGQTVTITGRLDDASGFLRVVQIEPGT